MALLDVLMGQSGSANPSILDELLKNRTPGINPNAPGLPALAQQNNFGGPPVGSTSPAPPEDEGLVSQGLSKLGKPGRALMPISQFLGKVSEATTGAAERGTLGALAPRFQAGVQQGLQLEQGQQRNDLNERFVNARIAAMSQPSGQDSPFGKINISDFTTESAAKFQETGNVADLQFRNKAGSDPAAVKEFEYFQSLSPEKQTEFTNLKRSGRIVSAPGVGFIDPTTREVVVPEEEVNQALADRAGSQRTAADTAAANVKTVQETPGQFAKDEAFIEEAEGFIEQLKGGSLNTGPVAGLFPAISTNSQLFRAFSGKNVISSISDATFGSLSEGERAFIETTNPSRGNTEEANIEIIEQKIKLIKKAQEVARQKLQTAQPGNRFEGFSIAE